MEDGGGLRDHCLKLSSDAERWIAELQRYGIRPTLGHGMMLRCSAHVEQILRECSSVVLRLTGEEGLTRLRRIHSAALPEKLTLGQQIRFLKDIVPRLHEMTLLDELETQTWDLFDTVLEMRNAFMHAREVCADASLWIRYLEASRALCHARLVQVLIEADERETNGDPGGS